MPPASRNEIHTAEPATAPAWPRSAKIPAPTMAPTPRNAAPRTVRPCCGASEPGGRSRFARHGLTSSGPARTRQGALLSCDVPDVLGGLLDLSLERLHLRAEPVERLLGVLLRVGTGLRELVAGVADRLADLVDLTGQRLDVLAGLVRFLLGLSGLVTLVVEIALETERPDRETAGDEQEQHARGDPAPRAVMPSLGLGRRAAGSCVGFRHVRERTPPPARAVRRRADSPR